jgi:hypothetical protein
MQQGEYHAPCVSNDRSFHAFVPEHENIRSEHENVLSSIIGIREEKACKKVFKMKAVNKRKSLTCKDRCRIYSFRLYDPFGGFALGPLLP